MLICLEASAEDAARTAWTTDVRYHPRLRRVRSAAGAGARRSSRASRRATRPRRARALARHAGVRPHGRRADDVHEGMVRRVPRRGGRDAAARPRAHDQDGAGDRAASGSRTRSRRRRCTTSAASCEPGMKESEVAALWQGYVHGEGTARDDVELALPFSLVWAGKGIKTFTATGDLPVVEGEPVLFEIWVCADGYWADHTKNLVVGELKPEYAELEEQLMEVYDGALGARASPGARWPSFDRVVRGTRAMGYPGQPSHPICHGIGARAHEPPYPHQAGGGTFEEGMVLAVEPGVYWEGGGGLRVEDNFLDHARRAREAVGVPGRGRCAVERDLDRRAERRVPPRRAASGCTTRRCATASRPSASCSTPSRSSRSRGCSTSSASTGSRPGFPRVSQDDWDAVKLIAGAGLRAQVWGFSRAVPADLEALVELGVPRVGDRVADLRPEAERDRRRPREDARADHERDALRRGARHPRRVLRRRLDARGAGLLRARLQVGGRGGREGGRRRRHARHRVAGGGRRARREDGRVGRAGRAGALPRAQRLRARDRGCGRRGARGRDAGSRGRSTAWASARATRTSARSR